MATVVLDHWATVDWSWAKEWNWSLQADLHYERKRAGKDDYFPPNPCLWGKAITTTQPPGNEGMGLKVRVIQPHQNEEMVRVVQHPGNEGMGCWTVRVDNPMGMKDYHVLWFTGHDFLYTQEIKRMLFNWMKQDKTCKFSRKSSFLSYVQHKNRKTIHNN